MPALGKKPNSAEGFGRSLFPPTFDYFRYAGPRRCGLSSGRPVFDDRAVQRVEPLRVANRFAGDIFSWRFVSIDGRCRLERHTCFRFIGLEVSAGRTCWSSGRSMTMRPDWFARSSTSCGGCRNGTPLAAVDTGAFLLAEAGCSTVSRDLSLGDASCLSGVLSESLPDGLCY